MKTRFTFKRACSALLLSMATLAAVPAGAEGQSGGTLKVAAFGGTFTAAQKKYIGDLFARRTGMKVQYIDGNANELIGQLIASKGRTPPYDVLYLEQDVRDSAIPAGVFAKIDPAIVTNLKHLYDEAKQPDGYGPGMAFYSVGIAYNTKKFAEAGIPAPTSWKDLWNPKLAGRVAIPDLSTSYGREFLIAVARMNGWSEKNPDQAVAKIAEIKAQSYFTSSAQVAAQFQSGDVWVAPWINARTWGMIDQGAPLKYVIPAEGGIGNIDTIDVAAGSPNMKAAQEYVNMALSPLAQLGNATDNPLGPANKLLAPVLKEYPELAQRFPASPEDLKKLYMVDWAAYLPNRDKMVDLWNRAIAAK